MCCGSKQMLSALTCALCVLFTAYTPENWAKSADCNVAHCEKFKRSVVKQLQFYKKKGCAKNTAVRSCALKMESPL
jgi:hypothetical protein